MYAIIDLETTGANSHNDRITEVAIIVHDGQKRLKEFSSLVNPGIPIPPYITGITNITDEMVAGAPQFYEIAKDIVELTEGCVFVAHNARFDYGFIQNEFRSLGYDYKRDVLCTVKFSRKVIPGHASYSLGKICRDLGIPIKDRHRAMGDADATAVLLEHLLRAENGELAKTLERKDEWGFLPEKVDKASFEKLPKLPGIFYLHDANGEILYIDSDANIRTAAKKFAKKLFSAKKPQLPIDRLYDVTFEVTGTELLARLKTIKEVADNEPPYNPRRNYGSQNYGIYTYQDQRGYIRTRIGRVARGQKPHVGFSTQAQARSVLRKRVEQFNLCFCFSGLSEAGACTVVGKGHCFGACQGLENPEKYNQRAQKALKSLEIPQGNLLITGAGRSQEEYSIIHIEAGSFSGFGYMDRDAGNFNPETMVSLVEPVQPDPLFNRVLRMYLPLAEGLRIIPYE